MDYEKMRGSGVIAATNDGYLLREHELTIAVNGDILTTLICTRLDLNEMCLGHLCSRGLVSSARDISRVVFSENEKRADITTENMKEDNALSCGSDAAGGVEEEQIFKLAKAFFEYEGLHRLTSSTHSAILFDGSDILCIMEDISRHCAIDKAIGFGMKKEVDLSKCMLFSSGRIMSVTVAKLINAQIPVLISKAAPTDDAVRLARENNITLIGCARRDGYKIYEG